MNIQKIQTQVIRKYNMISKLMETDYVEKEGIYTNWWNVNLLENKRFKGCVNQYGDIDFGQKQQIRINKNTNSIELIGKPMLASWTKTLNKINKSLDKIIENFNDPKVVIKTNLKILLFPKELVEKLQKFQKAMINANV